MNKPANTKEEKAFTASQVGSMLEQVNDAIKLLAESMIARFEGVDKKFDSIDKKFDSIDERFDKIETKIDRLQDDMVEVKYELKNKVNRDEFERLEKRVIKLEKVSFSH